MTDQSEARVIARWIDPSILTGERPSDYFLSIRIDITLANRRYPFAAAKRITECQAQFDLMGLRAPIKFQDFTGEPAFDTDAGKAVFILSEIETGPTAPNAQMVHARFRINPQPNGRFFGRREQEEVDQRARTKPAKR